MLGFKSRVHHLRAPRGTGTFGGSQSLIKKGTCIHRITGPLYLEVSKLYPDISNLDLPGPNFRHDTGSAWTFDELSGEYYLHLFCPEQPDLNWENSDVVDEVHQVMKFWLDKGVDGFRMDVINLISKEPGLPNAPVTVPGQKFQPADVFFANGPRLHEYLRGLRKLLDQYDAFAVGEMPFVADEQEVLNSVASERKELNMIFQFDMFVGGISFSFGTYG
jgi:glycosidase